MNEANTQSSNAVSLLSLLLLTLVAAGFAWLSYDNAVAYQQDTEALIAITDVESRWSRDLMNWLSLGLSDRKVDELAQIESLQRSAAEHRNQAWDPKIREAVARAAAAGAVASEDEALLAELDGSRDPSITVCAPTEFGLIDDDICRTCPGFAECGARAIRMAAGGEGE